MSLIWWDNRNKINIIVDNDSWIIPYAKKLIEVLIEKGFSAEFYSNAIDQRDGDIAFYLGCMKLVSKDTLALCNKNLVVHESDLPRGKGFSPLSWQILEGKNEIPVCLLEMTERADSGNIIFKEYLSLSGAELIDEMRSMLGQRTIDMCVRYVLNESCPIGVPQNGEESFYPRRYPRDSELDFNASVEDNFNLLRIVDNDKYPAFFIHKGRKYILKIESESLV